MSKVNQYAISAILNSEILGEFDFGHGQIDSLADDQRFLDARALVISPSEIHYGEKVDLAKVKKAFLEVRNRHGDRRSPDYYVAEPSRNAEFIANCRQHGLGVSDYILNKSLLNARKNKLLPGLKSQRTPIDDYEDFAFACEFAATELKYKRGASIDDILCDPDLSMDYDSLARKLAPGHSVFDYRWAILSIRKASGKSDYKMPRFIENFKLVSDSLDAIPAGSGAYLLYEEKTKRPLYARASEHLRHSVELHRRQDFLNAVTDKFWEPKVDEFLISFAAIPTKAMLRPIERKIIEEQKPVFNVPRAA